MNRENMETWIEALESGGYSQARRIMHDGEGFCCLGVLCDINDVEWVRDPIGDFAYYDGEHHRGFPGQPVMDWLGLNLQELRIPVSYLSPDQLDRLITVPSNPRGISVAHLNDYGFTFAEIASLLRVKYGIPA